MGGTFNLRRLLYAYRHSPRRARVADEIEERLMPWGPRDAIRHPKKATTPKRRRAFSHAANSVLRETGNEGRAIRAGNAAAAASKRKSNRNKRSARRA